MFNLLLYSLGGDNIDAKRLNIKHLLCADDVIYHYPRSFLIRSRDVKMHAVKQEVPNDSKSRQPFYCVE